VREQSSPRPYAAKLPTSVSNVIYGVGIEQARHADPVSRSTRDLRPGWQALKLLARARLVPRLVPPNEFHLPGGGSRPSGCPHYFSFSAPANATWSLAVWPVAISNGRIFGA
jgi:hypothetical protein